MEKRIIPMAFIYYYLPVVILTLVGFFDSIYLSISHYRVHVDLSYSSFCALSRALNCDTVSSSQYAVFLNIPLSIWGIIGYGFVLFILGLAGHSKARQKRLWPMLFWIALLFSLSSLVLAWVSTFLIRSYCAMCILTYIVNFLLMYYAWFINKRFGNLGLLKGLIEDLRFLWTEKKFFLPVGAVFLCITGSLMVGMPQYWHMKPPANSESVSQGITEGGHPWIGAKDPELIIEEFTDYLCTQCRIKHFFLRQLVAENPSTIRLIHRHFPMDHKYNPIVREAYHRGAGVLALFSIFAQDQDKFWEANDYFFQLNKSVETVESKKIAEDLDLNPSMLVKALTDRHILNHLQKDIQTGLKMGLSGTPGYIINDKVYLGHIPAEVMSEYVR